MVNIDKNNLDIFSTLLVKFDVKRIVHPKIKVLLSFTHVNFLSFTEHSLRYFEETLEPVPIDFCGICLIYNECQWFLAFFKISLFSKV